MWSCPDTWSSAYVQPQNSLICRIMNESQTLFNYNITPLVYLSGTSNLWMSFLFTLPHGWDTVNTPTYKFFLLASFFLIQNQQTLEHVKYMVQDLSTRCLWWLLKTHLVKEIINELLCRGLEGWRVINASWGAKAAVHQLQWIILNKRLSLFHATQLPLLRGKDYPYKGVKPSSRKHSSRPWFSRLVLIFTWA